MLGRISPDQSVDILEDLRPITINRKYGNDCKKVTFGWKEIAIIVITKMGKYLPELERMHLYHNILPLTVRVCLAILLQL